MIFQSKKEALTVLTIFGTLVATVVLSVLAVDARLLHPIWVMHAPLAFIFLLTVVPASWNRGSFWPCHPRVLVGSLLAVLTMVGYLVEFPPSC